MNESKLRARVENEFLPFVIKPGRYVGNELNSVRKDHDDRFRVALAFPDLYEIGMSHLGSQILYHIINKLDYALAERVFAPDSDAEKVLREKQIPLYSLESFTPIRDFDILGFTFPYELCSTNILNILDLAGIPLRREERSSDHPLILIGGSCTFNPEPLAKFADAFFIGDAEEAIPEIISAFRDSGDNQREALEKLSAIEGIYIPSFYEAKYENGLFAGLEKTCDAAPDTVNARKISELREEFYSEAPIVPFVEIAHDRLAVEIMRGCRRNCRFCQARNVYRPRRERDSKAVIRFVQESLAKTGFSDVTLLSLSSSDYGDIENVVTALAPRLSEQHVTLSLPSLRPNGFSLDLAKKLSAVRKSGLTLAPEAGTERLRRVINKPVPEDQFLDAVKAAIENDWNTLKLYFMVGLPTETDEDIDGICELVKKIVHFFRAKKGKKAINVSTSPFCPKPHTPWQWEAQIGADEIVEKQRYISKKTPRMVTVKYRQPDVTLLESALGRGDRRVGDVIEQAFRSGARLDAWTEHLNYTMWVEAYKKCDLDIADYHKEIPFDAPLPWDHIQIGVSKDKLKRDAMLSKGIEDKPDLALPSGKKDDATAEPQAASQKMEYGRRSKRTKTASPIQVPNSKVRVRWSKNENVRFMSHLDNSRVFERALRRAKVPVAYSQGYSPHQKLAFGPPLTLGHTSEAEYVDIQLEAPYQESYFDALNAALPDGFEMQQTMALVGKGQSLSALINIAIYEVVVPLNFVEASEKRIWILEQESIISERESKTEVKEVEIRSAIIDVEISELNGATVVRMTTGLGKLPFARPTEILKFGFGMSDNEILPLRFHRADLLIKRDENYLTPFEVF